MLRTSWTSSPRVLSMRREGGALRGELFVELGDAGLKSVERGALLRELLVESFEFCVDLREFLERANLVEDAQCVTPGR